MQNLLTHWYLKMKNETLTLVIGLTIWSTIGLITGCTPRATDPSGVPIEPTTVWVYVDPATGCQYLNTNHDVITPRMSKDGKQICEQVLRDTQK